MSYLDTNGLNYLWSKIKSKFYTKTEIDKFVPQIKIVFNKTGTSTYPNFGQVDVYDYTVYEKGQQVIQNPFLKVATSILRGSTVYGATLNSEAEYEKFLIFAGTDSNGLLFTVQQFNLAATVQSVYGIYLNNQACVGASLPMANYQEATQTLAGLMSSTDKTKLDNFIDDNIATDLNEEYNLNGVKFSKYNASTLNTPYSEGLAEAYVAGVCITYATTANFQSQFAFSNAAKYTFRRAKNNGTWTAWEQINIATSFANYSTDLNLEGRTNAMTMCRTNTSTLNTPYKEGVISSSASQFVVTYTTNANNKTQIAFVNASNYICRRGMNSGTWQPWVVVATTAVATTTTDGLMSAADKVALDAVAADYSAALTALGVN